MPLRVLLAGVAGAFLVAVALQFVPDHFFEGVGPKREGIRLLRDQYEFAYYFGHGKWLAEGALPYTERHPAAYPPLGLVATVWPRAFTDDFHRFVGALQGGYAVLLGLLAAATAAALAAMRRPLRLLGFLCLPAFLYFSLWRYDALPSVLVILAVLAAARDRPWSAAAALWAAVLAKVYPILLAIPFLLYFFRSGAGPGVRRAALAAGGTFTALTAVLYAWAAASGMQPLLGVIGWQMSRAFEVGSIRAVFSDALTLVGVGADAAYVIMYAIGTFLQFAWAPLLLFRGRVDDLRTLVRGCLFVLIPFMAFGGFFSQQWIIWLTPLLILVGSKRELWLLAALDVLLYVQFPVLYDIDPASWHYGAVTVLRTALLAVLWHSSYRELRWRRQRVSA